MIIWITGLAGSGKTTIAKEVYNIIKKKYNECVLLDGDNFRKIIGNSIGYSKEERYKGGLIFHNLCKFLDNENIIVICSVMILFKKIHEMNRKYFKKYIEIFLKVDFEELLRRDKKLLYSSALKGKIKNVVGIDIPYDEPESPDLYLINNTVKDKKKNIETIINFLRQNYNMEL